MSRTERVEPIKPKDILNNLEDYISPVIIRAVNEILKEQFRGGSVNITTKEIQAKVRQLSPEDGDVILSGNKWMYFEPIFQKAGWNVAYDQPGYSESYDSFYTFSEKK